MGSKTILNVGTGGVKKSMITWSSLKLFIVFFQTFELLFSFFLISLVPEISSKLFFRKTLKVKNKKNLIIS